MATSEEKRLAERKRVNAHYDTMQSNARKRSAVAKPAAAKAAPKKYPWAVSVLGQGFRNLYDTLGGR